MYRETIDAYNNCMYVLCGAGARAIIESICNNEGILNGPIEVMNKVGVKKIVRKKDLQGKINGLYEKGLLTKSHSDILHELRFLGNNALHEQDAPSTKDLKIAIDIVEHTFDNIYELKEKAKKMGKISTKNIK